MRTHSYNQPSSQYRLNIIHRPVSVMGRDLFCLEYSLTWNPQRSKLSSNASILKNWIRREKHVDVLNISPPPPPPPLNKGWFIIQLQLLPCPYL